ncbi:MAG: menaquinone biosynthetic enzyme MqnA/MqnD family protein, partial [Terriglobales bacterium]
MSRLRISAISYLNTAPLMWDFEHRNPNSGSPQPAHSGGSVAAPTAVREEETAADFDISYTIPSACARALAESTADIGIIPAAAYTTIPDLVIIPDIAIAARNAVRSILLVSKMPLDRARTVALDTSSMTSVALAKVLFARWLGGARAYSGMAPGLDDMLAACDAALLIGDPALQVDRGRYVTLDLAEEWHARTGKPFVFAFWAVRRAALAGHDHAAVTKVFQDSRDHGLAPENLEAIAQEWAPRLNLTLESVRTYLARNIHYYLDPPCLD